MKNISIFLCVLALVTFGTSCITNIVTYSMNSKILDERLEELEEDIEEHEEEYEEEGKSHRDCWECESHEETEKSIERSSTGIVLEVVEGISYALVLSGILFGIGEICDKKAGNKKTTAEIIPDLKVNTGFDNTAQYSNSYSTNAGMNVEANKAAQYNNSYSTNPGMNRAVDNTAQYGNSYSNTTKTCPQCGNVLNAEHHFCNVCGKSL